MGGDLDFLGVWPQLKDFFTTHLPLFLDSYGWAVFMPLGLVWLWWVGREKKEEHVTARPGNGIPAEKVKDDIRQKLSPPSPSSSGESIDPVRVGPFEIEPRHDSEIWAGFTLVNMTPDIINNFNLEYHGHEIYRERIGGFFRDRKEPNPLFLMAKPIPELLPGNPTGLNVVMCSAEKWTITGFRSESSRTTINAVQPGNYRVLLHGVAEGEILTKFWLYFGWQKKPEVEYGNPVFEALSS